MAPNVHPRVRLEVSGGPNGPPWTHLWPMKVHMTRILCIFWRSWARNGRLMESPLSCDTMQLWRCQQLRFSCQSEGSLLVDRWCWRLVVREVIDTFPSSQQYYAQAMMKIPSDNEVHPDPFSECPNSNALVVLRKNSDGSKRVLFVSLCCKRSR